MTPKQLQLLHTAVKRLGWPDARYRMLLRNVAGVESSKQLGHVEFEDVMAVLEDSGFRHADRPTYWRSIVDRRSSRANSRMIFKIGEEIAESRYELPALCERFSASRTADVRELTPREAWNLIEMLKAANAREA